MFNRKYKSRSSQIVYLPVTLAIALIYFVFTFYQHKDTEKKNNPFKNHQTAKYSENQYICIIGNSETIENALNVHSMWSEKFPSEWLIWGQTEEEAASKVDQTELPTGISVNFPAEKTSWADGIYMMLKIVRKKHYCEYIFTHDDDLFFEKNPSFFESQSTTNFQNIEISSVLEDVLKRYNPAIASFPWTKGDSKWVGMSSFKSQLQKEEVSVLTGFDSGMVIYHSSIVDFFIPYTPRGENGFIGAWTLPAHFVNMFGPLMFRQNAIQINLLVYTNLINMDNIDLKDKKRTTIQGNNELITVQNSRHPYEIPQNNAYITYLADGLRNPKMRWGRKLASYDVNWKVEKGVLPYNKWDVLKSINNFYDIRRPIITNNEFIKNYFTSLEIELFLEQNSKHAFIMHIFSEGSKEKMERLWDSLNNAYQIDTPMTIFIHIDFDHEFSLTDSTPNITLKKIEKSLEFLNFAKSLTCIHGEVLINMNTIGKGTKNNLIDSWTPLSTDEYSIMLDDSLTVSKHFLEYADQAVKRYFYGPDFHGGILGISLYNTEINLATDSYWDPLTENQMYVFQQPQPWGAIYGPIQWSEFIKWYCNNRNTDTMTPNSYTNNQSHEKSWIKYLTRFMYQNGKYMIYPNFPGGYSLSTNYHLLDNKVTNSIFNVDDETPKLPLLDLDFLTKTDVNLDFGSVFKSIVSKTGRFDVSALMPALKDSQVYNIYGNQLDNIFKLRENISANSFDKCTMIITIYNNPNSLTELLLYYQDLEILHSIIVIWNKVKVEPPVFTNDQFKKKVKIIRSTRNSLNNRFFPHKEITTDCILNIDEDWKLPYNHMRHAYIVWKRLYFNQIVGHASQGRTHLNVNKRWIYLKKVQTDYNAVSIMLPAGMVYHRKYLELYTNQVPQRARNLVDEFNNCDDILFNFVVANETKTGPVVLDNWNRPVGQILRDSEHFEEREYCLNEFYKIFGYMPLMYTTSVFNSEGGDTVPPLSDLGCINSVPYFDPLENFKKK